METDDFAQFATELNFSALPSMLKEKTKLAVINLIAVGIGANAYEETKNIVDACKTIQDGGLPVYGSGKSAGTIGSAWANSALGHYLDFDDTHLETIVHPSAPVIPAALSLGQVFSSSGKDALVASAIGMEAAIRLAQAVGLDERYSDWHNTSLYGTSASAVTSSLIMHEGAEKVSASMLEGLTVATGFLSNRGTTSKSFQVGRSAAEGIISAFAISNGITVSKNILNTFSASLSTNRDLSNLTKELGKKWVALDNFLKPYPCGVVLHPGIDAAIQLKERNVISDDIESIDVYVNPVVMVLTAILDPKSGLQSKFSITHAVAAALVYGPLYPEHFSDEAVNDRKIAALRKKIKVHEKGEVNRGQTIIEVRLKGGRREASEINRGPEVPSKELNEADVKRKFHHLSDPVLGKEQSKMVWDYFDALENKTNLSEISELF